MFTEPLHNIERKIHSAEALSSNNRGIYIQTHREGGRGFMKYSVEMGSRFIFVSSFIYHRLARAFKRYVGAGFKAYSIRSA
jgi:hypothetical protein